MRAKAAQRLSMLEAAQQGGQAPGCIVIYDVETGQPLTKIRRAAVQIWLPDNGREGVHGKPQRAPAEGA